MEIKWNHNEQQLISIFFLVYLFNFSAQNTYG